jgi:NADPH-dependent 2,4-dienoyl-CoA reductase/sulfur reductase-like enzyme
MTAQSASKTILEPAREIRVAREADVVVVVGGPGSFASAISAARSGAKTVLIERYGHLGPDGEEGTS